MRNGLSKDLIARVLGGAPKYTIEQLEEMFPQRNLPDGAFVTRFAPSPTGYMHIGGLYGALIDCKLAQQSNGVFMLRIEDTDTKREVQNAVKIIEESMQRFGLNYNNVPEYGPYYQSQRKDIYHSVVAELLATGRAYPCFLGADDMEKIRENQKAAGFATGIYGEFARDRDLTEEEIVARLDSGLVPSIRLYSVGNPEQRIFCKDAVRGSIGFPENNEDIVLIKSNDGLPTYHFAHLCDDHFMRTTHVIRGEEWLPSLPLHVQLFRMMGWNAPLYIHTSTIDKIDEESGKQRKLSKRKDPEANVAFFLEAGWPVESVIEYLGNIAASGYEEAKMKGQVKSFWDYEMRAKKIPMSGALFDMKKLEWWA
ncbi:MAG: glutamate--tRNA ligase, partial [Alphaproteobacteria bacterium]|nr:glutamate--tRNA ligase [Alphaproteobacteria bacterium]